MHRYIFRDDGRTTIVIAFLTKYRNEEMEIFPEATRQKSAIYPSPLPQTDIFISQF